MIYVTAILLYLCGLFASVQIFLKMFEPPVNEKEGHRFWAIAGPAVLFWPVTIIVVWLRQVWFVMRDATKGNPEC